MFFFKELNASCACSDAIATMHNVAAEIVVDGEDWRTGRWVVELAVIADALSACKTCGLPLQLAHSTGITTFGLSAVIKCKRTFLSLSMCYFAHFQLFKIIS